MEAAHAAHVADEEELTQNHPQTQPDQVNVNDLFYLVVLNCWISLHRRFDFMNAQTDAE